MEHESTAQQFGEDGFRLLVQNAPDLILVLDAEGKELYASPSCQQVIGGYPVEERRGKNLLDFVHPEDAERAYSAMAELLATPGGTSPKTEFRVRMKDGSLRYFESTGTNLLDEPNVAGIVINAREITERKQAEDDLKESEERFRALLQNNSDIIAVLDADGTKRYVAPSSERVLGYSAEEWLGSNMLEDVHPDDVEEAKAVIGELLEDPGGVTPPLELRMRHKDGSWRYVEKVLTNLLQVPSVGGLVVNARDVTERKQSEGLADSLVRNVSDLVMVINAGGYINYLSPSVEDLLGFEPSDVLESSVADYIHPDDLEKADAALEALLVVPEGEESETTELRIRHADGSWRYLESVATNQLGDPAVGGMVIAARDTTGRREIEETLAESEARFRGAFENASTGMALVGLDGGRSIKVNRALCEVLGYSEEELLQKSFAKFTHPDDLQKSRDRVKRLMAEDGPDAESLEKRYICKDGREVWVISVVSLVRDASGAPSHFVTQVQDITERKLAEERLRALADAAFEGIVITEHGIILEVNRALSDILGYEPDEMVGESGLDFVAPEHREESYRRMASGSEEPYEVVGLRKDGERRDLELRGKEFSFRDRPARVAVVRDITDRKRMDRELQESNRRLKQLAAMKADFTAMVAHELDTPLSVVRGFLDVLEEEDPDPGDWRRMLSILQAETDKMVTLVSDVREAAIVERDDFAVRSRPVPVEELLAEAARFARSLIGEEMVEVELSDELPEGVEVLADPNRIGQVLRNLISNAVKYSPEGEPIALRALDQEDFARFEVVDRGPGINPEDAARMFEKFGRGRDPKGRRIPGLGLGLYISRRIIRTNGGELTLHSIPGEGSAFRFTLKKSG